RGATPWSDPVVPREAVLVLAAGTADAQAVDDHAVDDQRDQRADRGNEYEEERDEERERGDTDAEHVPARIAGEHHEPGNQLQDADDQQHPAPEARAG